jgi:predicted nucleic acid-binding protein
LLDAYVAAVTVPTIFYVGRKLLGINKAREAVRSCLQAFRIVPVYRQTLEDALQLAGPDFEDNVQIVCAGASSLDVIITRDASGFAASPVTIVSPREMLRRLNA